MGGCKTVFVEVCWLGLVVSILNTGCWSTDDALTEPDFFVHGLCFSPYKSGQAPPDPISVEQFRERLRDINRKPHTQWLRSYSAANGLEDIPAEAQSFGHKVAMGVWIRSATRAEEIDNLIEAARNGWVDIAVVGNEELYARECGNAQAASEEDLVTILADVRQRLDDAGETDVEVTTPEPFDTLFRRDAAGDLTYRQVLESVDLVFVNIYPFHRGIHIDGAVTELRRLYEQAVVEVNEVSPGKPVVISETGWPSEGETKGAALPSLENAERYFFGVLAWVNESGIPLFYFEAFDEHWKGPEEIERHWGIWDAEGRLKIREP